MLQDEACEEALKCNDTEVDGQHIRVERCKPKAKGAEAGAASETPKPPAPKKPAQKVCAHSDGSPALLLFPQNATASADAWLCGSCILWQQITKSVDAGLHMGIQR